LSIPRQTRSARPATAVPGTGYRERNGVGLAELTAFELFSEFRERVLSPALAGLPQTRDLVIRCGRAMLAVLRIEGPVGEFHREALGLRITDRLKPDEWQRLLAVLPEAAPAAGPLTLQSGWSG
jgi:hypothetical protein